MMSIPNGKVTTDKEVTQGIPSTDSGDVTDGSPTGDDNPPPNGGWLAWLQVAGCFGLYLNSL